MNQNNDPYKNVEFCRGIDANIVKDTTKILPWNAVKDIISKQIPENNLYEVTKPNKPIKIFIDIDGEASQNITQSKFNVIVNCIMNQLSQLNCAVMNSSKYEHTYIDNDGKEKVSNKYSFRLTFHKYISCISKMVAIIENEYYPMLKNELKDIIDIDFGNKTVGCLNIDKAVYRTKGVGKMRAPNAYKGKTICFKNNHFNSFEYDRPNHIVKGNIQDNLIHYIDPNDEFIDIKDEPVENKIIEKQEKKTKTDDDIDTKTTIDGDVEKFLDLIDVKYLSNYKDWTKIIWAGKVCNVNEDFLRQISQKCENYTDNAFDNVYNGYSEPTSTIGTIKYYARLSNEKEYLKINADSFKVADQTDLDVAKLYLKLYGDNYIYKDGVLYTYYANKWRVDEKPYRFLKTSIQTHMIEFLNKAKKNLLKFKVITEEDMVKFKTITQQLDQYFKKISKSTEINNICETFINHLSSKQADLENVFDVQPYIFCFNNRCYDLLTGKVIELSKEDYITQNTHYDFVEPTKEQMETIDKLYKQIFPNPEIRKCWLSIQFMGMTGIRLEKFILANGCGRNGKGLINELFQEVLGTDYFYKLPVDVLQSKMDLSKGANPQVANMDNVRFILSSEPEENDKLRINMIKELTGCKDINARKLFQNACKVRMVQVMVLECNEKPKLSGKMNHAVMERIIDVPFVSKFVSNLDDVNEEANIYPINSYYKSHEFQQDHKCALFKYILDNAPKELFIPTIIQKRSIEYVMDSDELYEWFGEEYELTNNKDDILKMKDVYSLFKESDFFCSKTKEEKRKLNYKGFISSIAKSVAFQGKYYNDSKKINGFTYNERIIKYKVKDKTEDE